MQKIGFPIPAKEDEHRLALCPENIAKTQVASYLIFEKGYGEVLGFSDDDYQKTGASVADRDVVCQCPIICDPKPVISNEYFRTSTILFGWIHAVQGRHITDALVDNKMTAIAWEEMFENGRHCFWRNNEIAGEASVMQAFLYLHKLPYECSAAVIGRGNVARGAIRMLEKVGCAVTVYDRKTSPLLRKEIKQYDVIINAVLWDVFRSDHLIYEEDLVKMKRNSMIIDISCDETMGIQSSHPTTIRKPIFSYKGILHYAVENSPSLFYRSASIAISNIVSSFLSELVYDRYNDTLHNAVIVKSGEIVDEKILRFQKRI